MGKQRVILEHVTAAAGAGRHRDVSGAVKENFVVEKNATGVRAKKTGDGFEGESFSGTAGTEQNRDTRRGVKFHVHGTALDEKGETLYVAGHNTLALYEMKA